MINEHQGGVECRSPLHSPHVERLRRCLCSLAALASRRGLRPLYGAAAPVAHRQRVRISLASSWGLAASPLCPRPPLVCPPLLRRWRAFSVCSRSQAAALRFRCSRSGSPRRGARASPRSASRALRLPLLARPSLRSPLRRPRLVGRAPPRSASRALSLPLLPLGVCPPAVAGPPLASAARLGVPLAFRSACAVRAGRRCRPCAAASRLRALRSVAPPALVGLKGGALVARCARSRLASARPRLSGVGVFRACGRGLPPAARPSAAADPRVRG